MLYDVTCKKMEVLSRRKRQWYQGLARAVYRLALRQMQSALPDPKAALDKYQLLTSEHIVHLCVSLGFLFVSSLNCSDCCFGVLYSLFSRALSV